MVAPARLNPVDPIGRGRRGGTSPFRISSLTIHRAGAPPPLHTAPSLSSLPSPVKSSCRWSWLVSQRSDFPSHPPLTAGSAALLPTTLSSQAANKSSAPHLPANNRQCLASHQNSCQFRFFDGLPPLRRLCLCQLNNNLHSLSLSYIFCLLSASFGQSSSKAAGKWLP